MRTYKLAKTEDGTPVTALTIPNEWGLPLLQAIHTTFKFEPGGYFIADLLKVDKMFPADWYPMQRRERINRLFDSPVQIGDLVFSIESTPGRMYQKTRKLVAVYGQLTDATPTPQTGVSHVRAAVPRLNALSLPDAPGSPPRDDLSRVVESLATALKAVTERLEAVEVEMLSNGMTLDGEKFHTSEERIMRVVRRLAVTDRNLVRMEEAIAGHILGFTYSKSKADDCDGKHPIESLPTLED